MCVWRYSETETSLSTHLASFKVLDDDHIQVTTSKGEQEIVNELVLTCPIPNVRSCTMVLSGRFGAQ